MMLIIFLGITEILIQPTSLQKIKEVGRPQVISVRQPHIRESAAQNTATNLPNDNAFPATKICPPLAATWRLTTRKTEILPATFGAVKTFFGGFNIHMQQWFTRVELSCR